MSRSFKGILYNTRHFRLEGIWSEPRFALLWILRFFIKWILFERIIYRTIDFFLARVALVFKGVQFLLLFLHQIAEIASCEGIFRYWFLFWTLLFIEIKWFVGGNWFSEWVFDIWLSIKIWTFGLIVLRSLRSVAGIQVERIIDKCFLLCASIWGKVSWFWLSIDTDWMRVLLVKFGESWKTLRIKLTLNIRIEEVFGFFLCWIVVFLPSTVSVQVMCGLLLFLLSLLKEI